MTCLYDRDCPGAYVCYTNATWYNTDLGGLGNGCLCSTWYGFSGVGCTGSNSPAANFWLASCIILTIVCFVCCGFALLNAWKLHRSAKLTWKDATYAANVQVFFTFLLTGVDQIISAIESQVPSMVTMTATATSDKIASSKVGRETIFVLAVCSVIVAAMTIALVWLEVGERARRMAHRVGETMIPKTRQAVIIFEVVLVIAMIAACAALMPSIAVVIGIIAIVVVMGVYVAGFCKIYGELKAVSSIAAESSKIMYRAVIKDIQRTTVLTLVTALVLLIVCIVILVLSFEDWKQTSLPNSVPGIIIAWQALHGALVVLGIVLLEALRRATSRKIASGRTGDSSSNGIPNGERPIGLKTDLDTAPSSPSKVKTPTAAQSSMAAYQLETHVADD